MCLYVCVVVSYRGALMYIDKLPFCATLSLFGIKLFQFNDNSVHNSFHKFEFGRIYFIYMNPTQMDLHSLHTLELCTSHEIDKQQLMMYVA